MLEFEPNLLLCFAAIASFYTLNQFYLTINVEIQRSNIVLVTYLIRTFHTEYAIKLNFHSQNMRSNEWDEMR